MNTPAQIPNEGIKYNLIYKKEKPRDCIYEGFSGDRMCFTTKYNEDEWRYYFLRENQFRISGSNIEITIESPKVVPVHRETEPIEYMQVKQAWDKVFS